MLYIVATPIGNLEDITFRALRILKEANLILCEDTRHTKILLDHYQIKTPFTSYHQHSKLNKINYIADLIKEGKNLALVTDAGTPCISDSGSKLINLLIEQFPDLIINPIPGPSALISAASISGFGVDKFIFLGFLPLKKHRQRLLEEMVGSKYPVIFYESPYRVLKTLEELKKLNLNRQIVVSRELTKKFETVHRGNTSEILEKLKKDIIKGEFVVIIDKNKDV